MSFDVALAEEIWTAKYRFKTDQGVGDSSFAETAARVARAVASAEAPDVRALWEERYRDAISDFRFIPAGRVLASFRDHEDAVRRPGPRRGRHRAVGYLVQLFCHGGHSR